jgi:hypothetical protein
MSRIIYRADPVGTGVNCASASRTGSQAHRLEPIGSNRTSHLPSTSPVLGFDPISGTDISSGSADYVTGRTLSQSSSGSVTGSSWRSTPPGVLGGCRPS